MPTHWEQGEIQFVRKWDPPVNFDGKVFFDGIWDIPNVCTRIR
jgi:hypothetical protein